MQETLGTNINRILLVAVVFILGLGTIFYHFTEHWSWLDAYYFCVVTLATVGYGDLTPHTPVGKLFTTFYIFVGVGIITTFLTFTLRNRAQKFQERQQKRQSNTKR